MRKITIEMPMVTRCTANQCAYNVNNNCHARAITVGDTDHPSCDTFVSGVSQNKHSKLVAGIGACKTSDCKFNDDLECMADSVQVGIIRGEANCTTFAIR